MTGTGEPALRRPGRVKVLLMAAGLGTRLRPLTDATPKCLVPVAGRPLIEYWLDLLAEAGLRDVLVNTHHLPDQVRAWMDAACAGGRYRIQEAHEPVLLGSAGTVAANRRWADDADTVLIVYADNLSDVDLRALLREHASHPLPLTMLLFRAERPERCGIAELDAQGTIVSFVEKPERPRSDLANAGLYCLTADAFREMADVQGHDLGFDVLPRFVGRMRGFVWPGYHRDVGDAASLAAAEEAVRSGRLRRVPGRGDAGAA